MKPLVYRTPFKSLTSFAFLISFVLVFNISNAQYKKYSFTAQKMGSPFNLLFFSRDSMQATLQADQSFRLIDSLNHIFSNYDSTSELSIINRTAGIAPSSMSPLMFELVLLSQQAFIKSNRTFSISIGPLSLLWRQARLTKNFPSKMAIEKARLLSNFNSIIIDSIKHTIYLPQKGMQLDFGGIAKGYIAQRVIERLYQNGIQHALADAGGDIVMSEAPPTTRGWKVGINVIEKTNELLSQPLLLQNICVATSGDVYQYFEHNGAKYSHIINPATGYGITSLRNVTVIARSGAGADWLATACSILPIKDAKKLALDNAAELLITEKKGNKVLYHSTPGFKKFF